MGSLEQNYYEWEGFWDPDQYSSGENAKRIAATVELIPRDVRTVADIGCGTGEFGRMIQAARAEVTVCSIDRSQAALRQVTTEKLVGSVDAIPLEPRSKDLVSCLQVIEHIPHPAYERALHELARVAARYLLVSVPFDEDLTLSQTKCPDCGTIFNADLHLRSYDQRAFSSLFDSRGFKLIASARTGTREQTLGLATYERVRSLVAPRPTIFLAPSCPICGYVRSEEATRAARQTPRAPAVPRGNLRNAAAALKGAILRNLPKRRLTDYWIIGLFERTERAQAR